MAALRATIPVRRMRRWGSRGVLIVLLGLVGASWSCGGLLRSQVRRLASDHPQVLYYVDTEARAVALTIDDGPDTVSTAQLLDLLARHEAKATFFIITGRVPGNEELLRRMLAEGHELGNHMPKDEPSLKLPPDEFERQLRESSEVLAEFTTPRWFRPGSGRYDDRMLAALQRRGYRCALGSVYPFDPQIPWSWFSTRFILAHARAGSIVILHDGGSRGLRTVRTLSTVLPTLRQRGYRVVTLTELERLRGAGPEPLPSPPPPPAR